MFPLRKIFTRAGHGPRSGRFTTGVPGSRVGDDIVMAVPPEGAAPMRAEDLGDRTVEQALPAPNRDLAYLWLRYFVFA
jgi:hypothetical protein